MSGFKEADIVINGQKLSVAEAMTLRVAVSFYIMEVMALGLGNSVEETAIAEGYTRCGMSIIKKMHEGVIFRNTSG